jgi:hypothetical protein
VCQVNCLFQSGVTSLLKGVQLARVKHQLL